jgi:hypothetical protein
VPCRAVSCCVGRPEERRESQTFQDAGERFPAVTSHQGLVLNRSVLIWGSCSGGGTFWRTVFGVGFSASVYVKKVHIGIEAVSTFDLTSFVLSVTVGVTYPGTFGILPQSLH